MKRPIAIEIPGRALLALLFAGLLLAGSLAPHDAESEASGLAPWQSAVEAATHPYVPAHIEAPAVKTHSGCTACLLQLQTQSSLAARPAVASVLLRGEACAAAPNSLPALPPTRLSGARAPPAPPLPQA